MRNISHISRIPAASTTNPNFRSVFSRCLTGYTCFLNKAVYTLSNHIYDKTTEVCAQGGRNNITLQANQNPTEPGKPLTDCSPTRRANGGNNWEIAQMV